MEGQALKLLLIEDNPGDARLLKEFLHDAATFDFRMTHADTFQDAVRCLDDDFDLILLDLSLPDSHGLDTLTRLHSQSPDIPLVVLTGLNDEALAIEAVRQGAQDYLVKSQIDSKLIARSVRYAVERYRALEALRESEERYALAARAANDGLWDWNLRTDHIYYSPRWCLMLGYEEDEISDHPYEWFDRIHPLDLATTQKAIEDHLRGRTHHFEQQYRILHRDGHYRWMLSRGLALYNGEGVPYRLAGSQTDITKRKHAEERLRHDALHDPLTGLPNRVLFQERLEQSLKQHGIGAKSEFAVLFLDLDRFKMINDSLGHLAGDELLTTIAKRLENCISPKDTVARFGGDEFAILVQNLASPDEATRVAERILQAMKHPFRLRDHEVFSTGSIGISLSSTGYTRPEEMLRDADTAMYRAKASGRARYQVFDTDMHDHAMATWRLETDLRRAVERQEFRIHYQPIVSFHTGRLAGFEALVRWQHPERGLLHPADFLELAEETGLIGIIDRWTIRSGAAQMKQWHRQYPHRSSLFLSVNLSGSVLNQPGLPQYLKSVLHENELDPRRLKLEITESVVMNDVVNITRTLADLRALNVQLCIDDFGTGYSSLSSLHYYPIDTLKIDSSFITGMISDDGNTDIVRTIISLAHDLDLEVIAEGVETSRQFFQLQALDCEFGQGALFSQAMDHGDSRKLIVQNPHWTATS